MKKAVTYTHPTAQYAFSLLNSMAATASAKEMTKMLTTSFTQKELVSAAFDLAEEFERVARERELLVHGEEGKDWSFVNGRYRMKTKLAMVDDSEPLGDRP